MLPLCIHHVDVVGVAAIEERLLAGEGMGLGCSHLEIGVREASALGDGR